ncbi:MAG: DUF4173 domain-containing protein [Erysipelotrichia bacterium]|nr:DUF4173 domain-containing protein [Erysipelotrichia bacterium]
MSAFKRTNVIFTAAIISYFPAWYYVHEIVCSNTWSRGMLLFSIMYIGLIELLCFLLDRKGSKESIVWALLYLLQSIAMYCWDMQSVLGFTQILFWHLSAVYYALARCGGLSENRTGRMLIADLCAGIFILPWKNIFLRIRTIAAYISCVNQDIRKTAAGLLTAAISLLCLIFVFTQLSQASSSFAYLTDSALRLFSRMLNINSILYILFSLPVGMWLFGLIGGTLNRDDPVFSCEKIDQWVNTHQMCSFLPSSILLILLNAVYLLFFGLSVQEFLAASSQGLSAPHAASFAVSGFYQLCNMVIFNTMILSVIGAFAKSKNSNSVLRTSSFVFSLCSILFALLDFGKLYTYIHLYGITERRFTAFFALIWLLGLSILMLISQNKPVNVKRIAFLSLVIGFTVLSLFNISSIVDAMNSRYTSDINEVIHANIAESPKANF